MKRETEKNELLVLFSKSDGIRSESTALDLRRQKRTRTCYKYRYDVKTRAMGQILLGAHEMQHSQPGAPQPIHSIHKSIPFHCFSLLCATLGEFIPFIFRFLLCTKETSWQTTNETLKKTDETTKKKRRRNNNSTEELQMKQRRNERKSQNTAK